MITTEAYFMGRDVDYPPSDILKFNAEETVRRANILLTMAEMERGVRSGYRPPEINAQVPNAAPHSKHMTCQAVDIADNDGKLKSWCLDNLSSLDEIGLWMESPEATPTWCHVQWVPPLSGHRVFYP